MDKVDLRPMFNWTCPGCGAEAAERIPYRQLDPSVPHEWAQIVSRVESDLASLSAAAGCVGTEDCDEPGGGSSARLPLFPRDAMKYLNRINLAASGNPVDAYTCRGVPGTVTCKVCDVTYLTRYGKAVLSMFSDDDETFGE